MKARLVIAAVGLSLVAPAPAGAASPGENGALAFTCGPERVSHPAEGICLVAPEGGGVSRVDSDRVRWVAGTDAHPSFSPDGRMLAWTRQVPAGEFAAREVFVASVNGSGRRRLTTYETLAQTPTWSRDGSRIAFELRRAPHHVGFGVVDVRSGSTREFVSSEANYVLEPDFSPNAEQLAFSRYERDDYVCGGGFARVASPVCTPAQELHVAAADASEARRLTYTDGIAITSPDWAPDGGTIVAACNRALCEVDPLTGTVRQVAARGAQPVVSPDGRRLAYVLDDQIVVSDRTGASPRVVGAGSDPDWQAGPTDAQLPPQPRLWSATPGSRAVRRGDRVSLALRCAAPNGGICRGAVVIERECNGYSRLAHRRFHLRGRTRRIVTMPLRGSLRGACARTLNGGAPTQQRDLRVRRVSRR